MKTFKFKRFKENIKTKATDMTRKQKDPRERTPAHYKKIRIACILSAMLFGAVFYGLAFKNTPSSEAIEPSEFNAGRIIDDSVFYNPNTMTVAEIQAFLDSKSPACDMWGTGLITGRYYPDGVKVPAGTTRAQYAKVMREKYGKSRYHDPPYVCLNKFYENTETHQTLYETQGVATAGMKSAAQIIYDVAQEYSINPQVLLVLLKKESSVWGDNWPLKDQYNTVMGYGCPDTAPCNEAYYGFYNQVQKAAWQFKYYREHPNDYRYRPNTTANIYYHPNFGCGTKPVYLENIATTSLYIYTPYTPNDAALRAYPGEGDGCSSYGNRNFYMFFREWFGSTYGVKVDANDYNLADGKYRIVPAGNLDNSLQVVNGVLNIGAREGSTSDVFSITKQADGSYVVTNDVSGMSLDVANNAKEVGTEILVWQNHGGDNQKWKFYRNSDGTYSFATMLSLSMAITLESNKLSLDYYSKDSAESHFYLVPVAEPVIDIAKAYRLQSVAKNDLYFDIYGNISATDNYGLLSTYIKKGGESDNQTFKFVLDKTGYYRIINTVSNLNVTTSSTNFDNLGEIVVTPEKNECGQLWSIKRDSDGALTFRSSCSEKAIDLNQTTGEVILFDYHGGNNQRWAPIEIARRALEEGTYIISSALSKDYKLALSGDKLRLSLKQSDTPIRFTVKYDSYRNTYQLIDDNGSSLDLANNSLVNGGEIIMYPSHQKDNQRWYILPSDNGAYTITSIVSNKSIDVSIDSLQGGTINQWSLHSGVNQQWIFTKIDN